MKKEIILKKYLSSQVCMMSPKLLSSRGITVRKVVQEERDLIVVFPHAYHSGFNHGFNIAEASNFGTPRWVEHGKRHRMCTCSDSDKAIHLDMTPFVERFQPETLPMWRSGKDQNCIRMIHKSFKKCSSCALTLWREEKNNCLLFFWTDWRAMVRSWRKRCRLW